MRLAEDELLAEMAVSNNRERERVAFAYTMRGNLLRSSAKASNAELAALLVYHIQDMVRAKV